MLDEAMRRGADGALARLGLKHAAGEGLLPAVMGRARSFASGQLAAGSDLLRNLRGGFGGQPNPDVLPHSDPAVLRAAHRQRAVGNLKTLAPSLLAGGLLYRRHRNNEQEAEQQRQMQAAMVQGGYGPPMA